MNRPEATPVSPPESSRRPAVVPSPQGRAVLRSEQRHERTATAVDRCGGPACGSLGGGREVPPPEWARGTRPEGVAGQHPPGGGAVRAGAPPGPSQRHLREGEEGGSHPGAVPGAVPRSRTDEQQGLDRED